MAEPFARLAPPLLSLWRELVQNSATWFWPAADGADADESAAFLSAGEVVQGGARPGHPLPPRSPGPRACLAGSAFIVLDELREYMPEEEEPELAR